MKGITFSIVVMAAMYGAASAQTPRCDYDRCALRLQYRASGVRIVQGRGATPVARIGFFAPRVNVLAGADDSTRFHYEAFREYHNRGATLGLVSLAFFVGGTAAFYSTDQTSRRWSGIALFVVGFGVSVGADWNIRRGHDELSRTLWLYNRSFATP